MEPERQDDVATAGPHLSGAQGGSSDGVERLLYTPIEAAKALGLSRTTVYDLMREGRLAFVLIGTARRLPVAGLSRFVAAEASRQGFMT